MKPSSKNILDKIIDVKLAGNRKTVGPGSFVVLKRHVTAAGKFHPKTRVGRVEKIDGDGASVYFRYNDRKRGSSRVRSVPVDNLHLVKTSDAHKLHRNLFKGLVDEPPVVAPEKTPVPEKPEAPEKTPAAEKPEVPEKTAQPDPQPDGTDVAGDEGGE